MTVNQTLEELLKASKKSEIVSENKGKINEDNLCYEVDRIGSDIQKICAGKIKDIIIKDFGKPLHFVIFVLKLCLLLKKKLYCFTQNIL